MDRKMAATRIDANEWNNWRSKIFLSLIFLSKQMERERADRREELRNRILADLSGAIQITVYESKCPKDPGARQHIGKSLNLSVNSQGAETVRSDLIRTSMRIRVGVDTRMGIITLESPASVLVLDRLGLLIVTTPCRNSDYGHV